MPPLNFFMERVGTAERLPDEIFDEIFGAGSPRAFSHYSEMQAFLSGGFREEVLSGYVELIAASEQHVHSWEGFSFVSLASLQTDMSLLAFGYESEASPRPLTMKMPQLHEGNGKERAARERRLLASLRGNPLWVQTLPEYDMVEHGIVMECLWPALPLYDLITKHPEVIDANPKLTAVILQQIAQALVPLHEQNVIHRDLKPDNVFIMRPDEEGHIVKMIDPGMAKFLKSEPLTVPGGLVGTPGYMAPEQRHGLPIDQRTDLYALGCLAYHLLTKRKVFKNPLKEVCNPVNTEALDGRPKVLVDLVLNLLQIVPSSRPQNLQHVIAVLDQIIEDGDYSEKYTHQNQANVDTGPLPAITVEVAQGVADAFQRMANIPEVDRGIWAGLSRVVRDIRRRLLGA